MLIILNFHKKEKFDEQVIHSAFEEIVESKTENMEIHFVYAGLYYKIRSEDRLKSFILKGMTKYNIKKVMVTIIYMWRRNLITKEAMENYCNGKKDRKESVNDDLEKLFEDIQLGTEADHLVPTYFLPKLTEDELDLVERKDEDFMQIFASGMHADVDKAEMLLSESNSKFVRGWGLRKTFTIVNS